MAQPKKRQTSSSDQAADSKGAKMFGIAGPAHESQLESLTGRGWFYFYASPVDKGGKDRMILCKEHQVSWVDGNQGAVLEQGNDWTWQPVSCDNGKEGWRVLNDDIFEEEEVHDEDDQPMAWGTPELLPSAGKADIFANTVKHIMKRHDLSEDTAYKIVFSTSRD
tara:strand:- start:89 stop:583 length:495 start_codon:yes stop_codon:yes gene_type:complete